MTSEAQPEAPIVFISYSHDSDAHKKWVRDLAKALRERYRIDVILDQWEISPGDDVPKFMGQSLKRALRVIMICTEPYVRKADDGEGGAGYEATIVTGELVANLGTRKFIPIIRQKGEKPILPTCISTRFYLNFSNDEAFDKELEELARTIHESPRFEKPPLGKNPFAAIEATPRTIAGPLEEISRESPEQIYELSLAFANEGNFAKWRELIHREKTNAAESLLRWKVENQEKFPSDAKELASYFLPAICTQSGLFAAAFGAFDSTDKRFHNQLSLIDSLRRPKGWERSGLTVWVDLPDLALFTYQALLGALAMSRNRPEAAYNLATTPISEGVSREGVQPLFKSPELTGWPNSLNHTCTCSWNYLKMAAKEWKWLWKIFGSEEEVISGISAYYLFLNTIEFISASKTKDGIDKFGELHCPLFFVPLGDEVFSQAQSMFYSSSDFIREVFVDNGITDANLATLWKFWMAECQKWLSSVYRQAWPRHQLVTPHHDLPARLFQRVGRRLIE